MIDFRLAATGEKVSFSPAKLLMAGYTGRDQAAVQAHIDELHKHGVAAPERVPTFYPVVPDRLTTAEEIEVLGDQASGEAEFVLLLQGGRILVGAGSDHTDRGFEAASIVAAKQMCAKIISRDLWALEEVLDHWDDIILRGWVGETGRDTLYQEGRLSSMLSPRVLLDLTERHVRGGMDGMALFSGTLATLSGGFIYSRYFETELVDEKMGRSLRCAYRVRPMDWLIED